MNKEELKQLRRDYNLSELNRDMLALDPMLQITKWLKDAVEVEEEIEANAMVLSTVGQDGQPSARVVLLKEVTDQGFVFYTNFNSRKGTELADNPKCCATFWWHRMQRQVRIQGVVDKISELHAAKYFKSRPIGSQWGAIVSPQSQVIPDRFYLQDKITNEKNARPNPDDLEKPKHWGGYLIIPTEYEFWQGRSSRLHDRFRYRRQNTTWQIERLAP